MKKIFVIAFTVFAIIANAQVPADSTTEINPWEIKPSKESSAYNDYRNETIEPPFGLKKVKAAVAKIKPDDMDNVKLPKKTWDSWTVKEKFTYCMIHGESYSQNCDAEPPIQDEHKKIFSHLPDAMIEADLSDRQLNFLKKNRDSVIAWIKQLSTSKGRVYLNFKEALIQLNAKETIPFLVDMYKKRRYDHDILTVLMLLMKEGKYEPFLKSQSYEKFWGESSAWMAYLDANKANQDLIMERAMNFYNGK